jgi:hypothetical protein
MFRDLKKIDELNNTIFDGTSSNAVIQALNTNNPN